MYDPFDEMAGLTNRLQSRRFWGNLLAGLALLLALICVSCGPYAPQPHEIPLLSRFALVLALAGFSLDDLAAA
jgi:hypothetical protein